MLFFLYGEDDYRSNQKLNQIRDKFKKDVDPQGYNMVVLDEDVSVESLSKELFQAGFLAKKKLIIVKNLLQKNISENLAEFVLEFLEKTDNDESNIVIFYENNLPYSFKKKLSGKKLKIWKRLTTFKFSTEFKKLPNHKIIDWIQNRFLNSNKEISRDLANKILSLTEQDLWILSSEIDKIINYNKPREISENSILEIMPDFLIEDNIFFLAEKLANKDKLEAIKLLKKQFELGSSPVYLLSMIIRQYRILLQIKSAIDENVFANNLSKYLSLHPFVIKKSTSLANKYSLKDLQNIYNKLLDLDKRIKSSKLKSETLLNLFFLSV